MDDRRFDSLVKAVALGTSRRRVLKGILGLGGAALVGSAAIEPDAQAARRPTPTPKPIKCPGQQTWDGSACVCTVPPAPGPTVCGPECCNPAAVGPAHSECCDNACCYGTCYGEELCCPTNTPAGGGTPIASVCSNGECCLLPDVCINGVCGTPFRCQNNDDCGDCETCNTNTGQCSYLCTNALPQCCVNGFGEYCIPAGETCCSSADDCTESCSYCNDVVRYCVQRCEGSDACCEGLVADECCAVDRCVPGQGCCTEGYIACGGRCCNASVYACEAGDCVCLPGTEACGQLPGGCCPDGQCNDNRDCCAAGTTACGVSCCDNATQTCNQGICECAAGLILCEGVCVDAQCCGSDDSMCEDLGYDLDCVACSNGMCDTASLDFQICGGAQRGYCSNGVCLPCRPQAPAPGSSCTYDNECCFGNCLGNQCTTQ